MPKRNERRRKKKTHRKRGSEVSGTDDWRDIERERRGEGDDGTEGGGETDTEEEGEQGRDSYQVIALSPAEERDESDEREDKKAGISN